MKNAYKLLEERCIPSIKHQSNKNFQWIWLVDDNTPKNDVKKLQELAISIKARIILDKWLSDKPFGEGNSCGGDWVEQLKKELRSDIVAITRYDYDDYLASFFVDILQKNISKINTCLDFTDRINIDDDGEMYLVKNAHNGTSIRPSNFVTLVEQSKTMKTPYSMPHYKLDRHNKLELIPIVATAKTQRKTHESIILEHLVDKTLRDIKGFEKIC